MDAAACRYDAAIEPYVSFLRKQNTGPVDYIMGLFGKYDVVILCERIHTETTQWDMIYELTSDPRFIDQVGVIFTEYGTVTLQPDLDEFLTAPDLPTEQAKQKLLRIYRDHSPIWPLWDNTNFYDYLKKLHKLNITLPPDKKVRLYFCDIPWDWSTVTSEQLVEAWRDLITRRDQLMAERIIAERRRRLAAGERSKCLVVMNYRHAFRPMRYENGQPADNTGGYVFEAFPDVTANVLINTVCPVTVRSDRDIGNAPAHDGKWDAAFAVVGNPELGFDFTDSPFGDDSFDLFTFDAAIAALHYKDVFTGFVFYRPIAEHRYVNGVPGLLDESFVEELRRRFALADGTEIAERYAGSRKFIENSIESARKQGVPLEKISRVQDIRTSPSLFMPYRVVIDQWLVKEDTQATDD